MCKGAGRRATEEESDRGGVCEGISAHLKRTAADVGLLGAPLRPPTPLGPRSMKGVAPSVHALQRKEAADLGHGIGN